jgi:hypothetical protein
VKVYRVPAKDANWRTFRIVAWGAVVFLFGILAVSIYDPMELGDPARRTLAWIAGAVVLSSVIIATVLARLEGLRKLKEGFQFELSDDKIIQTHEGWQGVEISLASIESLHEYRGWLVIRGDEPARQITIPSEVNDFEELKRALTTYRAVTPSKAGSRLLVLVPFALLIVACLYFFISNNRKVVIVAGSTVLLLQGLGFYSISRHGRSMPQPKLLLLMWVLIWLVTAWAVYERAKGNI